MDGIANVARQQQSQVNSQESQGRVTEQLQTTQQISQTGTKQDDIVKQAQDVSSNEKINSQKDVKDLVKNLNEAMAPLSPDIKFGVDQDDIFYVAAIDVKTDKIIRRFPAEKAQDFLPKMQEVSGILFDSKG
jgi:flagellar protein FlaG